ncbi:MAG: UDP-N-acetylmuramate--L-alanine ligase [Deltaproteobacteria bacterium]|jgi:UDP-N-acetylmuramate--alanine ligase|nr:UDP-N-acetylmuramate--L-alanine ligase [Deltaproteobacteria bacterium]
MYHKTRNIHFVGIGGMGMSGIAEVLLTLGHHVTGSDLADNVQTKRLASLGAKVFHGHLPQQVHGADVLVISSAVNEQNIEVCEAKRLSIPVIPRAEMLAELMRLKTSVAVAGAHGKTTTCSAIGMLLTQAGLDPTLVIGGKLKNLGVNARLGQGELMVAEADESDGSFLLLSPTVTVVTNIDREHMNYYRDLDHLIETFLTFINRVPFYGVSILCTDDPHIRALLGRVKKRVITYGFSDAQITPANVTPVGLGQTYDLIRNGQKLTEIAINQPGSHNVLNSLAAAAVGLELGLTPAEVAEGLRLFKGAGRRFEIKGTAGGVTLIDDYGHHPTEIKATLSTLAKCFPGCRRVILFQPNRFTRTKNLFDEFAVTFDLADVLYLTDIYPAGEQPLEGVNSERLTQAIINRGHPKAKYLGTLKQMPELAMEEIREGDVVMTLGSGNIGQICEELLRRLAERK